MNKSILAALLGAIVALCASAQDESDISALALGIQGGVGYVAPTGSLHNTLKGCAQFTAGITADYKRFRLKADFDYGQPGFKNENPYNIKEEHGFDGQIVGNNNATRTGLSVQLGYKVFSSGRISVTPAAGVYYTRLSYTLNDIKWKQDENEVWLFTITDSHDTHLGKTSWIASVDVDFKLYERNTLEPFFLNQRYSRLSTSLRVTPWVAGGKITEFDPSVNGLYVGATVRITGAMQSLGF